MNEYPEPKYVGEHQTFDSHYERRLLKNGKPGKRLHWVLGPWYTKLYNCDRCTKIGSPRKVHYRSDCHMTLCMGCWNTVKANLRIIEECRELCRLLRNPKRIAA